MRRFLFFVQIFVLLFAVQLNGQIKDSHPSLFLTYSSVIDIQKKHNKYEIFKKSFEQLKAQVDNKLNFPVEVPVPKDPAGGYTHAKHKENYQTMFAAGIVWQITKEEKYAKLVKDLLLSYAKLYPTLPLHPVKKSYAPGKLFWQSLNEAVWLVYTGIAYDCIYDYLTKKERKIIEQQLLFPYADFLSVQNPKVFNRIHNHGVWAVAAVGIIGLATGNTELLDRAFYGVGDAKNKAGFYVQMEQLFSPDGYYTEGPYYQRYAMTPFLLFAQAIDNNLPQKKIFAFRDSILLKAIYANLQLTDQKGYFFPINDAVKKMSYLTPSIISAVDLAYYYTGNQEFLDIADKQGKVIISGAGLKVAKDLSDGLKHSFKKSSIELRDGKNGKSGAIGILRTNNEANSVSILMKYTSQGLGHGHFDRLSFMLYNNGNEVFSDYGAVRYVNVLYKDGGRYLSENRTWAKQTIAHNTMTIDSVSNFNGNYKEANKYSAHAYFFDTANHKFQIMSAKENNAYKGVSLQRTLALINDENLSKHIIILDIFRINSQQKHFVDLAYYYKGQFMKSSLKLDVFGTSKHNLGSKNGYQHLWLDAISNNEDSINKFIFMDEGKFYSLKTYAQKLFAVNFVETGAADPNFNLRTEKGIIYRTKGVSNEVIVSSVEIFGNHNYTTELTKDIGTDVRDIKILYNDMGYTLISLYVNDNRLVLAVSNNSKDKNKVHGLSVGEHNYQWKGVYKLFMGKM